MSKPDPLAGTRGVVNVSSRREWDKESYRKKAIERQERLAYKGVVRRDDNEESDRPMLDGRDKTFLNSKFENRQVGRTQKVNPEGSGAEQGGFYCELCDKSYKDDMAFLEHVNSRMHQAKLGVSMHVKKSTSADVRSRLKQHVAKRVEETAKGAQAEEKYDFKARVKQLDAEEEERKRKQKEHKKRKKEKKRLEKERQTEAEEQPDAEMMQMMGFGGFGSSKK